MQKHKALQSNGFIQKFPSYMINFKQSSDLDNML